MAHPGMGEPEIPPTVEDARFASAYVNSTVCKIRMIIIFQSYEMQKNHARWN